MNCQSFSVLSVVRALAARESLRAGAIRKVKTTLLVARILGSKATQAEILRTRHAQSDFALRPKIVSTLETAAVHDASESKMVPLALLRVP
jgi:hypothetical protein